VTTVCGVDGCRGGWIGVLLPGTAAPVAIVTPTLDVLLSHPAAPSVIAIDTPIGLPERVGPGGRGPERHARAVLCPRQSSVFSIPARAAVMAEDYREAGRLALETSKPPRKVSRQAFGLFPKIRALDALMTPDLEDRIFESHPELAFRQLNGGAPMSLPKKVKNVAHPPGLDERRALLVRHGYSPAFLERPARGAGMDDLLDAAVLALVARRIHRGEAECFPPVPDRDGRGLRMAIFA
jgi:predicted RNase H-like nuclease